ncbi:DMT family transporter [Synechococcus sp. PCC 7336]|uniref:EamA family transporter n=1 Tax=Synechococcus sp. PCC 7336 TaxID=195250 RepID=UPI0012EABBFE|nr:EamA family transporter [Synechococcus sp. PCC 7336]
MAAPQVLPDRSVKPTAFVLLAIVSVQLGSALSKSLFDALGASGAVFLRVGFAALVLLALWRPPLYAYSRSSYRTLILFGLSLACMNLCFYVAIARIPLGIAVALEFIGPLGLSAAKSRQWMDLVWVGLAAAGIVLLAPIGQSSLNPSGIVFALMAGVLWAVYIVLSARTGQVDSGGGGLAVAMSVAALAIAPIGIASGGMALLAPNHLAIGFGVAMLSSVITYSLELEALRTMPVTVFGVLMSLEPMVAACLGLLLLGEQLDGRAIAAILLVTIAAAGVSFFKPVLLPGPVNPVPRDSQC